jgi:plasmid stability protein
VDRTTNLTLALDAELLRRARIRALERGTSVNAVVRELLEEFARDDVSSRAVVADGLLALSRRSRAGRGGRTWTRDELHDR